MENSKKQQPAQTPGQKNPSQQNEKQKEQVRPGQSNSGVNPGQNQSNRK